MSLFVSESIPWKFLLQIHSLPPGADSHSSIKKELKTTQNTSSHRKWNLSQFRWEGPDKLWFSIANRVGWVANWLTFIIGEDFDIFKEVFKVSRVVKLRPFPDIIFPDTFFRTQFNFLKGGVQGYNNLTRPFLLIWAISGFITWKLALPKNIV